MMTNTEIDALNITVEQVSNEIAKQDYDKATELLTSVIKQCSGKFKEDDEFIYLSFNNPLEHFIYVNEMKPEKAVYDLTINLSDVYRLYSICMMQQGKPDKAEKALKMALEFNPVNVLAMFDFADYYRIVGDMENNLHWVKEAHHYCYSREDLAKCFRYYGIYYFDFEKYPQAAIMNYVSLSVFNSLDAQAELYHIQAQVGKFPKQPTKEMVDKLIKHDDIQSGPTQSIINIAYALGVQSYNEKNYGLALFCFEKAYEFTFDDKVAGFINELRDILSK